MEISKLVAELGSFSLDERDRAAAALVELGDNAVPALEAFAPPFPGARRCLARVLGKIAARGSARALEVALPRLLAELSDASRDTDPEEMGAVMDGLVEIGPAARPAIAREVERDPAGKTPLGARARAVLTRLPGGDELLLEAARSATDPAARARAVAELWTLGERALDGLAEALASDVAGVADAAVEALHQMAPRGPNGRGARVELSEEARSRAARILGRGIARPMAGHAIADFGLLAVGGLTEGLASADASVRRAACVAVSVWIGGAHGSVVHVDRQEPAAALQGRLLELIADSDSSVRIEAAVAFARAGGDEKQAIRALTRSGASGLVAIESLPGAKKALGTAKGRRELLHDAGLGPPFEGFLEKLEAAGWFDSLPKKARGDLEQRIARALLQGESPRLAVSVVLLDSADDPREMLDEFARAALGLLKPKKVRETATGIAFDHDGETFEVDLEQGPVALLDPVNRALAKTTAARFLELETGDATFQAAFTSPEAHAKARRSGALS